MIYYYRGRSSDADKDPVDDSLLEEVQVEHATRMREQQEHIFTRAVTRDILSSFYYYYN